MLAGHRVHLVDTPTHITVKQTIGGANVTETKNEAAVRIKKLASQRQRETERERLREEDDSVLSSLFCNVCTVFYACLLILCLPLCVKYI